MSAPLALTRPASPAPSPASPFDFTDEQRALIRDTFANGCSDGEFAVLMEVARARRLNPLIRQIHFVQRWDSEKHRMVWATQASIDGLRAIAERTGLYQGQDEPEFEENPDGSIKLCRVRVWRRDWPRPSVGVAYWAEYVQTTRDKQTGKTRPTAMWSRMPHVMLAKVAESIALRKAFPEDIGGLYSDAEMGQADNEREDAPAVRANVKAEAPSASTAPQLPAAPPVEATPEEAAPAEQAEEEGPSSRAFSAYCDAIITAATLVAIQNLYQALLDGMHEESADAEHFTQGDDGAAARAYRRMAELGHRLSKEECAIVLRDRPFAEVLDTMAHITPGPEALKLSARWWVDRRVDRLSLDAAYQKKPWLPLVRRYSGATSAADVKRAGAALEAAIKLLSPPPANGDGASSGGASASSHGGGTEASSKHTAPAALAEFRTHIGEIPLRGADQGAARCAGAFWKRSEDFRETGCHAEALGCVLDALAARGIAEPHPYLTEIGVKNGYVQRPAKAA